MEYCQWLCATTGNGVNKSLWLQDKDLFLRANYVETIREHQRVLNKHTLDLFWPTWRGRHDDRDTDLHSRLGNPQLNCSCNLITRRGTQG